MLQTVLDKIYGNDVYLNYLRYNPRWYVTLNENPASINDFEKEVKINLKMTTSDKIENLRKQIDFINGMLKYLNSQCVKCFCLTHLIKYAKISR